MAEFKCVGVKCVSGVKRGKTQWPAKSRFKYVKLCQAVDRLKSISGSRFSMHCESKFLLPQYSNKLRGIIVLERNRGSFTFLFASFMQP